MRSLKAVLAGIALAACTSPSPSETETARAVAADSIQNGEWVTWGGDPGFMRYSPLHQIDRDNVVELQIAWPPC